MSDVSQVSWPHFTQTSRWPGARCWPRPPRPPSCRPGTRGAPPMWPPPRESTRWAWSWWPAWPRCGRSRQTQTPLINIREERKIYTTASSNQKSDASFYGKWWIPQSETQRACPVPSDHQTTELPQPPSWPLSPLPLLCELYLWQRGKLKWFYLKHTSITYVVYSAFQLTIIIAIFVFRDTNCTSSIKLSLLPLIHICFSLPNQWQVWMIRRVIRITNIWYSDITPNWGVIIAPHNDNDDDPSPPQCCH